MSQERPNTSPDVMISLVECVSSSKDDKKIPNVNVCQAECVSTKKYVGSQVRDVVEKYEVMDRNTKKENAKDYMLGNICQHKNCSA